ncbi:hypothetical protein DSL64_22310 [Dyadobacter luteus]|jgi:hypothetical protein|uniref:Uncharacterized protein n=1 Tax=Dyadobacter luteus TaxID=2259619 RepID=A0A3D8Y5K5_9BACT|nr:hypothetical protein [Dyadobacter luteus]REA57863.1 hypothetical protein DSL64_22310 [Dyadobacter luteus]
MRNLLVKITCLFVVLLSFSVSNGLPKNGVKTTSLLLNGQKVSSDMFSWVTRGRLSVGLDAGDAVPFYIYLKREGRIVNAEAYAHNHAVQEYEMAEILKFAKDGDQIVVDLAGQLNNSDRKIIVVKQKRFIPDLYMWLGLSKNKNDGC